MIMRCGSVKSIAAALLLGAGAAFGLTPEDRVDFADGLLARGLYEPAVREYLGFLRNHSDHALAPHVFFRLAEAYRGQENLAGADHFYRRLILDYPESDKRSHAEFRRAELFLDADRPADAARLFSELAEGDAPDELRAAAVYFLGYSRAREGDPEAAEQAFRRLLETQAEAPHAPLARLDLADMLRTDGRTEEAAELYRAVSRSDDPELAGEALFFQADLAFRREDYEKAAVFFERLLHDHPDHPRASESVRSAAWAFHYDGRHAAVLDVAEKALPREVEPTSEWLYLSANSRRFLMDPDKALADYDRLLALDPDGPFADAAAYEAALLALRREDYADAVRRATRIEPGAERAADVQWILAEAHAGAGDTAHAIQYLRRLLDRFPDHPRAADAGYRLGTLLQQREQWAEASAAFRQFAVRHPDHKQVPAARLAAGHARAKRGDLEGALYDWSQLIETTPEHALVEEALFRRGLAEIRLDRNETALDSLRSLRAAYPESRFGVETGYWIGVLYDRIGETKEAETEFRNALASDLPPEWDRRVRHALAGVLRRMGRNEETADLLQRLLTTPMRTEMAVDVLEWLARYRLNQDDAAAAGEAAAAWMEHPDVDPASRARAALHVGKALAKQGKTDSALEALEQGLAERATDSEALEARLLMGGLLADQDRWDEARDQYRAVVAKASEAGQTGLHASGLFGLADTAERAGDLDAAARVFMGMAILFDDPEKTPEALYRAARCYRALERTEEADAAQQELKTRYPEAVE